MAKKIAIIGGWVVAALALLVFAVFLYMRTYFVAPSAQSVASVVGVVDAKRALGVFAHPDDEQLVTGFFSAAKDDGAFTALVTGTKGEAGHQVPVVARQVDLGVVRKAEALKNGFALGIDDQEVWDYPDGGVPDVPMEEIVARVSAKMVAVQPDLVVTFWPASGATGHKDHMRMGLAAETAVKQVRAQGSGNYRGPRWIAYVITPSAGLKAFGGEAGRFVAANQPEPTHAMPGNTAAKLRGWKIHASQENYVQAAYGFPDWLLYALWDREFYYVLDLDAAG
ncbi:MAG: PIG-L family deacetylase [Hyphomonadaceae bacterium]|nr:PIG-L family deacetylase [Hyphomonadaceae bacterium]